MNSGMIVAAMFALVIGLAVWHKIAKDKRLYFYIQCPICGHDVRFRKAWIVANASKMTPTEIFKTETPCKGGCGADLSGLYIAHPFVRECFEGAEKLRMLNEEGLAFAQALEEQRKVFESIAPIEAETRQENYTGDGLCGQPLPCSNHPLKKTKAKPPAKKCVAAKKR